MIQDRNDEEVSMRDMDDGEVLEALEKKAQVQDMFRDDTTGYQPIIIKAS